MLFFLTLYLYYFMVRKAPNDSPGRSTLVVLSMAYVSGNGVRMVCLQPGQPCALAVLQSVVTGCVYGILCVCRLCI